MPRFLHEYIEIDGVRHDNGWWEIDDGFLVNMFGGHHEYIPKDDDIIIEANSWDDVDCSSLCRPESRYGWVAPDGTFYGCDVTDHALIARFVLKSDELTIEKTHVKIYEPLFNSVEAYTRRPFLTEEQVKTLKERGLTYCYIDNGIVDFEQEEVITKKYGKECESRDEERD